MARVKINGAFLDVYIEPNFGLYIVRNVDKYEPEHEIKLLKI